jgi:plasmid maintenance system antidote protein VapI
MQTALPQNRLPLLIERAGLKHSSVAAHCNVDQSTVYRWGVGRSAIPDEQKIRLADLFDVSIAFLMGWDSHEAASNTAADAAHSAGEQLGEAA